MHHRTWITLLLALLPAGSVSANDVDWDRLTDMASSGAIGNIKAIVISHNGELVYEEYFRGTDAGTLHQLNSVTKSIGATLMGSLNRQGLLDVNERVPQIFTQYTWGTDPALVPNTGLRVVDVLTQRHGLDWDEWDSDYRDPQNIMSALIQSPDWYYFVLSQPRSHPPGEAFAYSTGVSTLMSGIIRARTGMSPQHYAIVHLFEPLGIDQYHFEGYSPGGMGTGFRDWPFGDAPLGWAWWLTARDMLTLGEMYRNGGVHQGTRILDASWVRDSWQTYSNATNTELFSSSPGFGYGYQWWRLDMTDGRGRTFDMAYASGWGRQYIMIFPDLGVTLATTSDDYDYEGDGIGFAIRNVILQGFDMTIDERFTGSWYDPQLPGQGIALEVLTASATAVAYWFTFDELGEQQWFVAQGPINAQQADLTVFRTTGGAFLAPDAVDTQPVGSATLRFDTCDQGALAYDLEGLVGTYRLTRLTGECRSPLLD